MMLPKTSNLPEECLLGAIMGRSARCFGFQKSTALICMLAKLKLQKTPEISELRVW